jgi:hypothetical protein
MLVTVGIEYLHIDFFIARKALRFYVFESSGLYGCRIIAFNRSKLPPASLPVYKTYFPINDVISFLIPFLLPSDSKTHTENGRDVNLDKLQVK